ncbi:polygalacturonase QRT3-like [Ananas comosus]|uniref:Polygalacturonase QRT3 n=1 Tax=Ananas comosus TaxID=4615 RepID=A0A199UJQ4_ANACO|nr:polygalacturonase QRT3-like [Ananas comosus]OAY64810.1 Polygalacturonase QRT3 [Ananas comosus]
MVGIKVLIVAGLLALLVMLVAAAADHAAAAAAAASAIGDSAQRRRNIAARRMESLAASFAAAKPPSSSQTGNLEASGSRVYHVTEYGADPTGVADSTSAIARAIADAFRPPTSRTLLSGIPDLGGAEVDLDGGVYVLTSPLSLPASGGGNFKIHSGSLRASDNFPTDRYLIELWASGSSSSSLYEFITLSGLMLDSNFRGGGVAVVNAIRTTIDNCYITHFTTDGIWVQNGHETFIRNSFLGQHITVGNDPGEKNFTGTGIKLMGNDNAVTDVVVFSAATGILVSGEANTLTGVHCYNKATGWGGTGIYLKTPGLSQTRITNCYLDYTGIVSEDPVLVHISSSFFLGDANVVLKSINGVVKGVNIVDNMFSGTGAGVDIVRLDGGFTTVEQVIVDRNVADGMTVRSTVAKASVAGNASTWTADFSPVLLFPDRIGHVQYSLLADSAFPYHALRNTSGNQVVVESNVVVPATVHVAVDQSGG